MKMTTTKRTLVTCSLMLVAIICYGIGYEPGFRAFFLLGALFETAFWVRLLHRRPRRQARLDALKSGN